MNFKNLNECIEDAKYSMLVINEVLQNHSDVESVYVTRSSIDEFSDILFISSSIQNEELRDIVDKTVPIEIMHSDFAILVSALPKVDSITISAVKHGITADILPLLKEKAHG